MNNSGSLKKEIKKILKTNEKTNNVYSYLTNDIIPNLINEKNHYNENDVEGIQWNHIQDWFKETPITEEEAKGLEKVLKNYVKKTYDKMQKGGKKTRKHKKRGKKTRKH